MMRQVTLRLQLVPLSHFPCWALSTKLTYPLDDVKDIYRRAEGEELVVEGLREGTNLVGEE